MATDFGEVGSAHVRIAPKLDPQFTSKVTRDLDTALRGSDAGAQKLGATTRQAADNLTRAASSARAVGNSLGGAAGSGRVFQQVADDMSRAATSATRTQQAIGNTRLSADNRSVAGDLDRNLRSVSDSLRGVRRDNDELEASIRRVGVTGPSAFTQLSRSIAGLAAAYAGFNFFRESVTLASDLGESMSKAENVFKTATGTVKSFASTSSQAFGISQRSALEMGSTFGNLLTSMGLGRQAAAGLSVEMLKLGADLASFNNISIDEALGKIRSGLVGEFEPLRQLGVTLNADAVAAKALELGLAQNAKQVSSSAKIQATYALILEQTANAQGDFARTADGLANTQRRLTASWEDARIQIGEGLLPVALQIAEEMEKLIPVAVELGTAVGGVLATGVSGVIPTVRIFANALGTIAPLLEAIPEPLISVVANFVLLQKTLGKLGFDDLLTRPFRRAIQGLSDAAEDGLRGLGTRVKTRLASEVGGNVISDVFTRATGPATAAASAAGTASANAFAMGVRSTSTEIELWKPGTGTVAIREAGQVGQAAGQAAQGADTFGRSTLSLSQIALPALGVALAAGTTALGIWQQKRAEAAAAQAKHTQAMIADTEAALQNGTALGAALSASTDSVILASIEELGSKNRRDDLDNMTEVLDRNITGLQLWAEAVRSVGATGDDSTGSVQQFRKALLDLGKERGGLDLKFSIEATDADRKRVIDDFIRTGEVSREFTDNFSVGLVGNQGLLNQFNDIIDNTAEGFEQAKSAGEALNGTGFTGVVGAMEPIKKEVDDTKIAFKDAETAVDDFLEAVRSIGDSNVAALRLEEERQLAVQAAQDAIRPAEDVTDVDVAEGEIAVADAINKRTDAQNALNDAIAGGDSAEVAKAELAARKADIAVGKAEEELVELQRGFEETGFPLDRILTGMDQDAIEVRRKFDSIVTDTLAQTAAIADTQGADAAATFWDTAIRDTKTTLGPEYAQAVDAALEGRGLAGRTGREILLDIAVKEPLSPLAAQLLNEKDTLAKLLTLSIQSGGDIPDDLAPLLTDIDQEKRIQFAVDLITELGPDAKFDPALLEGLDTAAQRDLILRLSSEGVENLPFDPDEMATLLADKQFTKDLLINVAASGASIDTGSPLGQAVQKAVDGTPLELFLNPTLEGDEAVKAQLEVLSGLVSDKARLEGDVASPEFRGSISSVGAQFEDVNTKIDNTKAKLDEYVGTQVPEKRVDIITFGLPAVEAAVTALRNVGNEPARQDKEIHFSVFGQTALDAALRAVRSIPTVTTALPPPTAIGGIFSSAQTRLIAEAGSELVLPLSAAQHSRAAHLLEQAGVFDRFAAEFFDRMGAGAQLGGGTTRNVTMNVVTNDPMVTARVVSQELAREVV